MNTYDQIEKLLREQLSIPARWIGQDQGADQDEVWVALDATGEDVGDGESGPVVHFDITRVACLRFDGDVWVARFFDFDIDADDTEEGGAEVSIRAAYDDPPEVVTDIFLQLLCRVSPTLKKSLR